MSARVKVPRNYDTEKKDGELTLSRMGGDDRTADSGTTRPRPVTYRALRDAAARMPKNAILSAEGAATMDIGFTQLNVANARSVFNAGTYGT
jgi:hypothetical protein